MSRFKTSIFKTDTFEYTVRDHIIAHIIARNKDHLFEKKGSRFYSCSFVCKRLAVKYSTRLEDQ